MPSMAQLRLIHYLKRAGFLALFLLVGFGLYFGVQTEAWQTALSKLTSAGNPTKPETTTGPQNQDSFEAFLSRSSVHQLIVKATQLIDEPERTVTNRLARQNQKFLMADELVQRNEDSRSFNFGIATKLSALRIRETILFDNGLSSIEASDELRQLARQHLSSFDSDILRQANLSQLTLVIYSALDAASDESVGFDPKTLKTFKSICKKYSNDITVAEDVLELLQRIRIHADNLLLREYVGVFESEFGNSRIDKIKLLATDTVNLLTESEFELIDLLDATESRRVDAIAKAKRQIYSAIDGGFVSQMGYYRIFDCIRHIAKFGDYASALDLTQYLEDAIRAKPTLSQLASNCLNLKRQLRAVGQKLKLDKICDRNGDPMSLLNTSAIIHAVLFCDVEEIEQSTNFLWSITRAARRDFANGSLSVSIVFPRKEFAPKLQKQLNELESVPRIKVAFVLRTTDESTSLLDNIEQQKLPLLVLFDRDKRVVGVISDKNDFEKLYSELKNP